MIPLERAGVSNNPSALCFFKLAFANQFSSVIRCSPVQFFLKDYRNRIQQFILQGLGRAAVDNVGNLRGRSLRQVNPRAALGVEHVVVAPGAFADVLAGAGLPKHLDILVLVGLVALHFEFFFLGHIRMVSIAKIPF